MSETVNQRPSVVGDAPRDRRPSRAARLLLWAALSAAFVAFIAVSRVNTYLGVEAPTYDKRGREYVWRVWWRARHDVMDAGPSWGFSLVLLVLVALFLLGCVLALWIALVPDDPAAPAREPDRDPIASR